MAKIKSLEEEVNRLKDLIGIPHKLDIDRDIAYFHGYLMVKPEYGALLEITEAFYNKPYWPFTSEKGDANISPESSYCIEHHAHTNGEVRWKCFKCSVVNLHVVELMMGPESNYYHGNIDYLPKNYFMKHFPKLTSVEIWPSNKKWQFKKIKERKHRPHILTIKWTDSNFSSRVTKVPWPQYR